MSSKSAKSSESVSSAKPLEVVKPSRVKRTFTAQFKRGSSGDDLARGVERRGGGSAVGCA